MYEVQIFDFLGLFNMTRENFFNLEKLAILQHMYRDKVLMCYGSLFVPFLTSTIATTKPLVVLLLDNVADILITGFQTSLYTSPELFTRHEIDEVDDECLDVAKIFVIQLQSKKIGREICQALKVKLPPAHCILIDSQNIQKKADQCGIHLCELKNIQLLVEQLA